MALKYARDRGELDGQSCKEYSSEMSEQIPPILKPEGGGPNYEFRSDGQLNPWHYTWMLSNLRDDDMRLVVDGPDGRGGGIVKCSCESTGHYDHKREHAEQRGSASWKPQSDEHSIWDFVLVRADNSSCWLHPNWGDNNVAYGEITAVQQTVIQPPSSGRGDSGLKFYKYYKEVRVDRQLKFNKNKNEVKWKRDAQTAVAA